jgi:hypothetical protein
MLGAYAYAWGVCSQEAFFFFLICTWGPICSSTLEDEQDIPNSMHIFVRCRRPGIPVVVADAIPIRPPLSATLTLLPRIASSSSIIRPGL